MPEIFQQILPWVQLLIIPTLAYVINIERRLVRLETFREADTEKKMDGRYAKNRS